MAEGDSFSLQAPDVRQQPVSVTRQMAASLPNLRAIAEQNGLKIHHLGAGYPHPEITDPRGYIAHREAYYLWRQQQEGVNDPAQVSEFLREAYSYTDTLGPRGVRESFASVYGNDWKLRLNPDRLIPTVGASGGISLVCSVFERPGKPVAYITDAPTYAGFLARATLNQGTAIFSVEMDTEGPNIDAFRAQIRAARAAGYFVPCYYSVPDGHNPAGFSFSQRRREAVLKVAKEEGILILEDGPYLYINYAQPNERATPFLSLDSRQTIHLFSASKIGLPGPRVAFVYTDAVLAIGDGRQVPLADLLLTEASSDLLFQNPEALRGFEALLHDAPVAAADGSTKGQPFRLRQSLWDVAEPKLGIYRENRAIMMDGFEKYLGQYAEYFAWTTPQAGFFSVFTFLGERVTTDDAFISRLVSEHGVVAIPLYAFYPPDARKRRPRAGMDQLRLSFCFTESTGKQRVRDMTESVRAFCHAARIEAGLPGLA